MKITPIPSDKIVLLVRYFNLSLGIFLLITALFLNGCSSGNADSAVRLSWKNASKASKSLLQLAISENTSLPLPSTQVNSIKVATIPTTEKDKHLYLFNYNPDLCGKLGCLYTAYLDKGQGHYSRVISLYLKPDLPSEKQLISLNKENNNNASTLPCLDVQQSNSKQTLQKITYCFDGS